MQTRTKQLANGTEIPLYSAPASQVDSWVISMHGEQTNGIIVEVGAFDGLTRNNSLALEQSLDWDVILIEGVQANYEACVNNRRQALVLNLMVGAKKGLGRVFESGSDSGFSIFLPKIIKSHLYKTAKLRDGVVVVTLVEGLTMAKAPRTINHLSLDICGAELAVLTSFFSGTVDFVFETLSFTSHHLPADIEVMRQILASYGYTLEGVEAFSYFFSHESLQ